MNYLSPDKVFLFLVNSSGAIALFVWLVISVSQLRTRRKLEASGQELELKMWFFPYLTYATIAAIIALCIGMLTLDSTRSQMIVSLGLAAILVGIGLYRYRNHKDTDARSCPSPRALPHPDTNVPICEILRCPSIGHGQRNRREHSRWGQS